MRCIWTILPPTLLWGASFPLALAAVAPPEDDPGRLVGGIYAANTLGAIAGALIVSLALIPWIGTQNSERACCCSPRPAEFWCSRRVLKTRSTALGRDLPRPRSRACLVANRSRSGRTDRLRTTHRHLSPAHSKCSTPSKAAIRPWRSRNGDDGATEVDVNGHVEATKEPYDMKLQRMVGHLPALLHPNPKSVLGIGFGAGVSAGHVHPLPRHPEHHRLRNRAGDPAHFHRVSSHARITTWCTIRAPTSCSTTRAIIC